MMKVNRKRCKAFERQAKHYDAAAKAQTAIGETLLERLHYLKMKPQSILDLGAGTGLCTTGLKKLYPKAQLHAFDLAFAMLQENQQKQGWRHNWPLIQGDMQALPFKDASFDLIFSNQTLHWSPDLPLLFKELYRVLAPNGCLLFSTVGPDTFIELKKAWRQVDNHSHVNDFYDMHDLGDYLLQANFKDPVVDRDELALHYSSLPALLKHLKQQGVSNIHTERSCGLTTRKTLEALDLAYQPFRSPEGKYPLSYEVIYGQAWKEEVNPGSCQNSQEVYIPLSKIGRKK